jgi:hypothetical protein
MFSLEEYLKLPHGFLVFVWTAAWERILTCDNLIWKGYTLAGWCCICRSDGETMDHVVWV